MYNIRKTVDNHAMISPARAHVRRAEFRYRLDTRSC